MSPKETEVPSLQAQVQPSTARLGDLVALDIRVTHPPELIIDSPSFTRSLGEFEVYSSTTLPAERGATKWVDHFQAQLQCFATGPQLLPGVEVPWRDPMGHVSRLKTPEMTVTIEEVPPGPKDKGDIRGIKGVIGPVAASPWWWLLGAVVIGVGAFVLWKKRKRVLAGPPPPAPVPPDEAALQKLREIEATGWLEAGKIKEFYIALSDIVRAYLEGAFHVQALERTTNELLRDLRKKPDFPGVHQMTVKEFLEDCDLVKFAKFRPDASEARRQLAVAIKFVEETRALR
ncbi:MAG: hypothetical protein WC859_03840 [Elusimicrobiota bacterium]|jgi:hypothetical protein